VPSGEWLVRRLDLALRQIALESPELPLKAMLTLCEEQLHPQVLAACSMDMPEAARLAPQTCVVLVRLKPTTIECALLQDASLVLIEEGKARIVKDRRQDEYNAAFYAEQAEALRAGGGFESTRFQQSLNQMIDRERATRNTGPEGFITFTGLRGAAAMAMTGKLPRTPGVVAVLASDGAARYWEVFGHSPVHLAEQPLATIISVNRQAEMMDANGSRFPRVGLHDDQALLRIQL
jgi:hypothetical protein